MGMIEAARVAGVKKERVMNADWIKEIRNVVNTHSLVPLPAPWPLSPSLAPLLPLPC
jgi:hypothetical protein